MLKKKIHTSQTKSEQAYQAIKDAIIINDLMPGEEVSIGSLAGYLGISPTPVREAVARLNSDGLIKYEAHKRLAISDITENDVGEIYEARRLLEPYFAEKAVEVIGRSAKLKRELVRLREKAQKLTEAEAEIDYDDYLEIDRKLDQFLLHSSGGGLLSEVLHFISERSTRVRTFAEAASTQKPTEMMRRITAEHLKILEALLAGDHEAVRKSVLEHLTEGEARTKNALNKKLGN